MPQLEAGFSRVIVTPPMGIPISGYFVDRYATGVLDDLEANAVALRCGETACILIALDNLSIDQRQMDLYRTAIARDNAVAADAVFIACTHTHTGPSVGFGEGDAAYNEMLGRKLSDAARFALSDLSPAKAGAGVGLAPGISFVRRFRMKDGSVRTNPGIGNPDIVSPIGTPDETVQTLRLDREGKASLLLVHFAVHPDTIGGCLISADYPRVVRETVERALPGTKCLFFNGAEGDVNHIDVHSSRAGMDGFDNVGRNYELTRHMGRVIAGAVLQIYGKAARFEVPTLKFLRKSIAVPTNTPEPGQLALAAQYAAAHRAGHDDQIPYSGMELTTVVAESLRIEALKDGPSTFELGLTGIAFGPVAWIGMPGEPFTGIGVELKRQSPFPYTFPCCLVNGSEGYFPMLDAYQEGGYEARSSNFRAGVAEQLIREGVGLLNDLA